MLKAYINYPNSHITVHCDPKCGNIQAQHKPDQRYCRIDFETISSELQNFYDRKYKFAAYPKRNDMWLEIDFQDQVFEMNVLEHICRFLGKYYKPFAGLTPMRHCW